ncbi:MAG: UPF0182 family protein [Nocardioidaceae bacterium]
MSNPFAAHPAPEPGPELPPRRGPRPVLITVVVMALLLFGFSVFVGIWTEKLWFSSIGYTSVFSKLLLTRIGLFVVFGLLMAAIVVTNVAIAYRFRPVFRPATPEQMSLATYRAVIEPVRWWLLLGLGLMLAGFAGVSAASRWRVYLMWINGESYGKKDPYFGKDIGFYVFSLPWLHFLVEFLTAALIISLMAAALMHYVYGGIRLQSATGKFSGAAQAQISVLFGLLLLVKAASYYLGRFDLTSASGGLITGMTYTRDHALLPARNILLFIAIICAVIFFVNVFRRTWLLPTVSVALFLVTSILIGLIWPAVMQRFIVKPDEPDKEAPYIAKNIAATRAAFDLENSTVTDYAATTTLSQRQLNTDASSLPGIRLVDPQLVSQTFDQLQQVRSYYTMPDVLDVDRYQINGQERDIVLGVREMSVDGLPESQRKWANLHTVYTHGYGVVAAFGNQQTADGAPTLNDGEPVWAEEDLPPVGSITDSQAPEGSRGQVYFGEDSPNYSIVGKAKGGRDVELDLPMGGTENDGDPRMTTYTGKDGVPVGNLFNKLIYAMKFSDSNIILSDRVHANSKIIYDRSPRERVQKVAPWLTVDSDALPAVVDHRIVWILDGYTMTDKYPNAEKKSFADMTSDAVSPRNTYATLPTDQINSMRNAVKAVVDAYDGTVKLYAWDDKDPILKAWMSAFPGVVKPKSEIPANILSHMRYPEDMYKVQRDMLASYHVTDPKTFFQGNDRWDVPNDPSVDTRKQAPYRLTVMPKTGEDPVFSLTSTYVPSKRNNLAAFMSVGANAADPKTYGKFNILRLPDNTQVPGPGQIANQFQRDDQVAQQLLAFKRADVKALYGNLLTLPVGGGLLYVQPLYTTRDTGSGNYPGLAFVLVSFGRQVGIGSTLGEALNDVLARSGEPPQTATPSEDEPATDKPSAGDTTPTPTEPLPKAALKLLQQADAKFAEADKALQAGDLAGYQKANDEAKALIRAALAANR